MQRKSRPKFLDLFTLAPKMSVTAKISILHRISGVLLFISIPFILYVLHQSLVSSSFYDSLYGVVSNPIIKLVYLVLIWAFIYHLCSGVRFLFLDKHIGVEIKTAKTTAKIVVVISLFLTIVLGVLIW
jgi:succinate dehydrogenase / fumarate reductase cytochrome b subunit